MRIKDALGAAATAAALTAATVALAPGAAGVPGNALTLDKTGAIDHDGTITLTGTYRCAVPRGSGTVFIGSNVVANGRSDGIGGSTATCDGRTHRWRNTARPHEVTYRPGPVRADAVLMQIRRDRGGIPLPRFLSVAGVRTITLVARP
ncbi:DUF6299 family protein [Streptomyces cinnamoneus]|uniref:DUF6299 family protein n=1 Tax=Streptomyces cinnamoneus TaxID=53446 RepID=UPI003793E983